MTVPPIAWLPWSNEAFDLARKRDVPVLLSIGAVWCHWCHVMDQTTFANAQVAQLIQDLLVPVRVDNDQRPDINARYNMGGWPTVAFLTPEGEVLAGGTYMPPESFAAAVRQISDYYRANKSAIASRVAHLRAERRLLRLSSSTTSQLDLSLADSVYQQVVGSHDELHGGFGSEPKFPQVDALELALERYIRTGERAVWAIVDHTLRSMAGGGMYDREMGGFFRYSTTRDWSVPHYEKMLEDNARLLSLYLAAYRVGRDAAFRETAEGIIGYVNSTLYSEKGGYFYGSQDADESYYSRTRAERAQVRAPFIDNIAYTAWNAMMVRSYLDAGFILERSELTQVGLDVLERLWQRCWTPAEGMCQHWQGEAHLPGWLQAQAWAALVYLDAYEAVGQPEWLERAQSILDWMLANLSTPSGALSDMPETPGALGRLAERVTPVVENAVAAEALIRAGRIVDRVDYGERATEILAALQHETQHLGIIAAGYARAVEHLVLDPVRVVLVGKADDPALGEMRQVVWRHYLPNRVLITIDPESEPARLEKLGLSGAQMPRAYVCVGSRCLEPAKGPMELQSVLIRAMAAKPAP